MTEKQTPLRIQGISESLYAGFWSRLGSLLLDTICMLPFLILIVYVNGLGKNIYFYTLLPNLLFGIWYHVYLPKRYGGTPGKLALDIVIIRLDSKPIGWKEAGLRYSVLFGLTIMTCIITAIALIEADEETYVSLSWLERSKYLSSLLPGLFMVQNWIFNIWTYSEFIVLLTNERKRAIHDYIAGTVIVKSKYVEKIREIMNSDEATTQQIENT